MKAALWSICIIARQNFSHGDNVVSDGLPTVSTSSPETGKQSNSPSTYQNSPRFAVTHPSPPAIRIEQPMGLFRFTAEKRKPASTGFSANALMLFFDGRHRNLMPYLKRLREYPGGAESAKALAESWKTEYKRRPAMMDELKKAGF